MIVNGRTVSGKIYFPGENLCFNTGDSVRWKLLIAMKGSHHVVGGGDNMQ